MDYLNDGTGMEGWLEVEPLLNLDMGNYCGTAASGDDDDDNGDDIPNPGGNGDGKPIEPWKPGQRFSDAVSEISFLIADQPVGRVKRWMARRLWALGFDPYLVVAHFADEEF